MNDLPEILPSGDDTLVSYKRYDAWILWHRSVFDGTLDQQRQDYLSSAIGEAFRHIGPMVNLPKNVTDFFDARLASGFTIPPLFTGPTEQALDKYTTRQEAKFERSGDPSDKPLPAGLAVSATIRGSGQATDERMPKEHMLRAQADLIKRRALAAERRKEYGAEGYFDHIPKFKWQDGDLPYDEMDKQESKEGQGKPNKRDASHDLSHSDGSESSEEEEEEEEEEELEHDTAM